MSTACGRFSRSATKPPIGTLITASHSTIDITEPACAMVQPRSTSMAGPNENTTAKPTLNRPQIRPATITASVVRKSGRTDAVVAADDPFVGLLAALQLHPAVRPVSSRGPDLELGVGLSDSRVNVRAPSQTILGSPAATPAEPFSLEKLKNSDVLLNYATIDDQPVFEGRPGWVSQP